ncbi:hypothetical protein ACI2KR_27260 [Pseudomonas luteola]
MINELFEPAEVKRLVDLGVSLHQKSMRCAVAPALSIDAYFWNGYFEDYCKRGMSALFSAPTVEIKSLADWATTFVTGSEALSLPENNKLLKQVISSFDNMRMMDYEGVVIFSAKGFGYNSRVEVLMGQNVIALNEGDSPYIDKVRVAGQVYPIFDGQQSASVILASLGHQINNQL